MRLFSSGGLDVGLVHHPVDATELQLGPEISLDPGVVLPRTAPLARLPGVALGELSGHDPVSTARAAASTSGANSAPRSSPAEGERDEASRVLALIGGRSTGSDHYPYGGCDVPAIRIWNFPTQRRPIF